MVSPQSSPSVIGDTMKIYTHSTAPWSPSSYSILVNRTLPNIAALGHDIVLGTWYGLQGKPLPWNVNGRNGKPPQKITVLPAVQGPEYDVQTMVKSYQFHQADICLAISDVWVFPAKVTRQMNFTPWLPIDHDPVPQGVLDSLETAIYPMVYSRWGAELLKAEGIDAHYVPGSAPAEIFKPLPKAEARKKFAFPDNCDFLVTMVAANKDPYDRKGWVEGLCGFAKFAESHPDAFMYAHTNWGGAVDIAALVEALGLAERVMMPDDYSYAMGMFDENYMAGLYQTSDVLLNPAKSEGFGLPLIEAQLCGCPIAATDFSTTDEMLFAGWRIDGQDDFTPGQNSWRKRVYIDSVADVLDAAYRNKGNQKLKRKARNGALKFDNDTVFDRYWKPALKEIEQILERSRAMVTV